MPDPVAPLDAPADPAVLLAAFEQRVLTRDLPPPVLFDEASIRQRVQQALRQRLGQRHPHRLHKLTAICYRFLAQPVLASTDPALLAELQCPPDTLATVWRELLDAGLVAYHSSGHQRHYRLERPAEDWLLAVAKGETPPA